MQKLHQTIKWIRINMWHAMRSEISDYFKFFFFFTIEFNLHFSEKGYLFVRWSDGNIRIF